MTDMKSNGWTTVERGIYRTARSNDTYYIKFKKDGKWVGPTPATNEDGSRCRNITEARMALKRSRVDEAAGRVMVGNSKLTLNEAFETWLTKPRAKPLASGSLSTYRNAFARIPDTVRYKKVKDIRWGDVEKTLKATETFSGSSQAKTTQVFYSVMEWAVKNGHAAHNPVKLIERSERKKIERVHESAGALSPDEIRKLLDASEGWHKVFFAVGIFAGMRMGEILGLRWEKVDFKNDTLLVDRQYTLQGEYKPTKMRSAGDKGRLVLIDGTPLPKLLRELHLQQGRPQEGWVFGNNGTPYTQHTARTAYERALKAAGLPHRRFHDTRVTRASMLASPSSGVDYAWAAEQLGHTFKEFVDTYVQKWDSVEAERLGAETNKRISALVGF